MSETQHHPCGHVEISRGCGGCDPGAVEFVRDDFGPWRKVHDCELDLDAIEDHAHKTADQGSGSDPHTVLALVAEVRRLRAEIDECWVPLYHGTKAERDEALGR